MNVRTLIMASVAIKGVFRRFSKLSDEEKATVVTKVKKKLSEKETEEPTKDEPANDVSAKKDEAKKAPTKKDDDKAKAKKEVPEKKESPVDKPKEDSAPTEDAPAEESDGDLMGVVDGLAQEVEKIREDGKVDSSEVMGLFDNMIQMVNLLVNAKPKGSRKSSDDIVDRVAARGLQVRRKDKDLMSDTGGVSKGREREPEKKPPREENKKPNRTKDKPAEQRDKDTDNDKDMKKGAVRQAMIDLGFNEALQQQYAPETLHPLDRKSEMWGMPVPEQNYCRSVWSSLVSIIATDRGVSEKAFDAYDGVMSNAEQILRTPEATEVVERFEQQNQRPGFCAESIYSRMNK